MGNRPHRALEGIDHGQTSRSPRAAPHGGRRRRGRVSICRNTRECRPRPSDECSRDAESRLPRNHGLPSGRCESGVRAGAAKAGARHAAPAARRPLAAGSGIRPRRAPAAEARSLPAREAQRPAAGHRVGPRGRMEGRRQGLAAGRAPGAQGLRRGQHQLPPEPGRRLSGPNRGLQGGHPLAAGQRREVPPRPGPHRCVGAVSGRSPRGPAGHDRRRQGIGGHAAATSTSPAASSASSIGSAPRTWPPWAGGTTSRIPPWPA